MLNKFREWLWELNMIPCSCGCKDDHWVVKDTISGHVCEASIVCDNCGKETNYWAYGRTELPETYTALLAEKVRHLMEICNLKNRYKLWKFRKFVKRNPGGF